MSEAKLQTARAYIDAGNYQAAKAILETMPDNHTAQRWLRKLAERLPPETQPQSPLPLEPLHSHRQPQQHSVAWWQVLVALILVALLVLIVLVIVNATQQSQIAWQQGNALTCAETGYDCGNAP